MHVMALIDSNIIRLAQQEHRDNTHFHPSEFHGCHRKIAYKYHIATGSLTWSEKPIINPMTQRIFGVGHSGHDRYRDYLWESRDLLRGRWKCLNWGAHKDKPMIMGREEKLGIFRPDKCKCGCPLLEYQEVGFHDEETWFGGHVDAILAVPEFDGEHIVIDFKTCRSYAFKKLCEPMDSHVTQMQIYLYLSGLKSGKFIYECKDTQDTKEYLVPRNEEFIQQKIKEAKILKAIVQYRSPAGRPVLPNRKYKGPDGDPPDLGRKERECSYCEFAQHCWNNG